MATGVGLPAIPPKVDVLVAVGEGVWVTGEGVGGLIKVCSLAGRLLVSGV